MLAGCAAAPGPEPQAPSPRVGPQGSLADTLGGLAEQALAEGDLDAAENRYQRLLTQLPRSVPARVGLGRVALARGRRAEAARHFEKALAVDPAAAEPRLLLADLADDPARAREHLERARAAQPHHPGVLARLAEHTGPAPRRAASLTEALLLAEAHPFDPAALLDAGLRLRDAGRADEAVVRLEAVVGLYDRDPASAGLALDALRELSPAWADRRVVPVHVFLDAPLREAAGFEFRQRLLWLGISEALDPLLATRFVPASFTPFDGAPPDATLDSRLRGLVYQTSSREEAALFAGFTAEPVPARAGARHGVAVYMGRHLFVRDEARDPERTERVLAHELLHVYGGIHVAEDIDSLMNPSGDSTRIDALNADIARALAPRRFGRGGQERNVIAAVDVEAAAAAFQEALQVNLTLRNSGLDELLGDATLVGPGAWSQMQRLKGLDSHLADVSSFSARLFWASGQRVRAVALLELASQLYGRQSPQGRAAWAQAQVLRRRLRFELGVAAE